MEKNLYLEILLKSLDTPRGVSSDSIGALLSHVTDLHNTIGKSYEFLVDVMSGLVKSAKETKPDDTSNKKVKEYETQMIELRAKIIVLEQELERARNKATQMEIESSRKDEAIVDLKNKLDKISERSLSTNPSKASSVMKGSAVKKLEDLVLSPSPPTDFSYMKNNNLNNIEKLVPKEESKAPFVLQEPLQLKRKYDEVHKLEPAMSGIDENDNSRSSSSTYNKKEEYESFEDTKFKKQFKKVKRNENSKENMSTNSSKSHTHRSGAPSLHVFNANKKHEDTSMTNKPNKLAGLDADNSLQDLFDNFIDVKESSNLFKKKNFQKEETKTKQENQQLIPASLSADEALESDRAQVYRKGFNMVNFSQKSPLKNLELPLEPLGSQSIPITRNGRNAIKSETTMNLMQKMLNANKKRNSTDVSGVFKMSSITTNNTTQGGMNSRGFLEPKGAYSNKINEEDLVRTAYRSKAEREDLQGFDCDQCKKFYDYFADGIHIKSAAEQCDRCSRHKGKFPLPSTPDNFHENFSLNSQD